MGLNTKRNPTIAEEVSLFCRGRNQMIEGSYIGSMHLENGSKLAIGLKIETHEKASIKLSDGQAGQRERTLRTPRRP